MAIGITVTSLTVAFLLLVIVGVNFIAKRRSRRSKRSSRNKEGFIDFL